MRKTSALIAHSTFVSLVFVVLSSLVTTANGQIDCGVGNCTQGIVQYCCDSAPDKCCSADHFVFFGVAALLVAIIAVLITICIRRRRNRGLFQLSLHNANMLGQQQQQQISPIYQQGMPRSYIVRQPLYLTHNTEIYSNTNLPPPTYNSFPSYQNQTPY